MSSDVGVENESKRDFVVVDNTENLNLVSATGNRLLVGAKAWAPRVTNKSIPSMAAATTCMVVVPSRREEELLCRCCSRDSRVVMPRRVGTCPTLVDDCCCRRHCCCSCLDATIGNVMVQNERHYFAARREKVVCLFRIIRSKLSFFDGRLERSKQGKF